MNKRNIKDISETDLYKPIHDYFVCLGYNVNSEVKDCDITAVKDDELVVIEMKKSLNLKLITQAVKRQRTADAVFVAVPYPGRKFFKKEWKDRCYLLRRLEIGLMFVHLKKDNSFIDIVIMPKPFDREKSRQLNSKKRSMIIKEIEGRYGDYNTGGSNRRKIITAYRENAIYIASCLIKMGTLSTKQLRNLGTGDKTTSILNKNFYGWFERVDRGKYIITKKGKKELKNYQQIVDFYEDKLHTILNENTKQ